MFEQVKNSIITEMVEEQSDYNELDDSQLENINNLAKVYKFSNDYKDILCDSYSVYGLTDEEVIFLAHLTKIYELDLEQMCHLAFAITYHMSEDLVILMASLTKKLDLNELQTFYIFIAYQNGLSKEQIESYIKICKEYELSELMMSQLVVLYTENLSEYEIRIKFMQEEIDKILFNVELENVLEEGNQILKKNNR